MMVIYLPVKFEFDWTERFRVRVQKQKMWTDKRTKNGQMNRRNYTNFERNLVGGKLFGFVSIDIECKNISISGDIGGFILSTK